MYNRHFKFIIAHLWSKYLSISSHIILDMNLDLTNELITIYEIQRIQLKWHSYCCELPLKCKWFKEFCLIKIKYWVFFICFFIINIYFYRFLVSIIDNIKNNHIYKRDKNRKLLRYRYRNLSLHLFNINLEEEIK